MARLTALAMIGLPFTVCLRMLRDELRVMPCAQAAVGDLPAWRPSLMFGLSTGAFMLLQSRDWL